MGNIKSEDKCCSESLKELIQKKKNSPIIAQLNKHSIRNKFQFLENDVRASLDITLISETELKDSFPCVQCLLNEFSIPFRLDRY